MIHLNHLLVLLSLYVVHSDLIIDHYSTIIILLVYGLCMAYILHQTSAQNNLEY